MPYLPVIDASACVAQGDCAELLPEVFELTDDLSVVIGSAPLQALHEAADACPTGAIAVIDAETGEQVAP